jgi:hypothetical protein
MHRIEREPAVDAPEDRQQSGSDFGYDACHGDIALPLHDWSRVPSGLFHDFHQSWSIRIKDALNAGRLRKGVAALVEQRAGPKESDILVIEVRPEPTKEFLPAAPIGSSSRTTWAGSSP